MITRIKNTWQAQKATLLLCFAATFCLGLIAHAYGFFRNSLSHDVLNAFFAGEAENKWKIELGRYFVPAYRFLTRGGLSLPWLIGLLGLCWTAAGAYFTVRLFDVRSKAVAVLICGIMVTNITYISQIAAYLYEFDINAFALLLAIAAVWLWQQDRMVTRILGSLAITLSMGLYQAYFSVAVSLILMCCVFDVLNEKPLKQVLIRLLWGAAMSLVGGIVYFFAGKIICAAMGIVPQSRVDIFAQAGGENPVLFYLRLMPTAIRNLGNRIIHTAYPRGLVACAIALCGIVLAIPVIGILLKKRFSPGRWLLLIALAAALPFAMQVVFFLAGGEGVHDLMAYAAWLFYLIPLLACQWLCRQDAGKWLVKAGAYGLAVLILLQNIGLANTAYVKKELEANASLSAMTRVVAMMEQQDGYVLGQTTVAFIGNGEFYRTPAAFQKVSTITGLSDPRAIPTDMDSHYYNAYRAYFDYVLQYPIVLCGEDIRGSLRIDPRVEAMPAFPADGCMAFIDNILVVNMG